MKRYLQMLAVAALVAGCGKSAVEGGHPVRGEAGGTETFLAYEHRVDVAVDGDARILERQEAVRRACNEGRFGSCSVLQIEQGSGRYAHGTLGLRLVPEAVEPMVALAAEGGQVGSRQTSAEDLGAQVADTGQKLSQLRDQRVRLQALQSREDLAVSDLIALTRELSLVDTQIETLDKGAAQLRHRLETNRLTLSFRSSARDSAWSRLGGAFADFGDALVEGISDALEWLAYGLPLLVLVFPLALLWRWLWRRFTRARKHPESGAP